MLSFTVPLSEDSLILYKASPCNWYQSYFLMIYTVTVCVCVITMLILKWLPFVDINCLFYSQELNHSTPPRACNESCKHTALHLFTGSLFYCGTLKTWLIDLSAEYFYPVPLMVMDLQSFSVSFCVLPSAGWHAGANGDLPAPSAMGKSSDLWRRGMGYPLQIERSRPKAKAYEIYIVGYVVYNRVIVLLVSGRLGQLELQG